MLEVKLTTVGNSVGAVFPKEVLQHLNVEKGDRIALIQTPTGYEMRALPAEAEVSGETMQAADSFIRRYHKTLRKLSEC